MRGCTSLLEEQLGYPPSMKPSTATDFPIRVISSLCILSYVASTVALTAPTNPSLELTNATDFFPILSNATSLDANNFNPHCVPDDNEEEWYNEPVQIKWRYDTTCYETMRLFSKEQARHGDKEFEFLAPGAQPTTLLPTMQTPRRYTVGRPHLQLTVSQAKPADWEQGAQVPIRTRHARS